MQYEIVGTWTDEQLTDTSAPVSGREYLKRRQEAPGRVAAVESKLKSVTADSVREWRGRQERKTYRWFALVPRECRERFLHRCAGPAGRKAFVCASAGRGRPASSSRREASVDKPKQLTPEEVDAGRRGAAASVARLGAAAARAHRLPQETIEQGLAKLVLGLIELLRQLLERQAIRRMEGGTLSDEQVEEMGLALMKLEEKIKELAEQFGLKPEDLNLNLGPLGNLLE